VVRSVLRTVGRARRVTVGTLAAALLIGGCSSSGPSQLGAAAIVGDTTIPIEQVQAQVDTVLAKEGEQTRAQLVAGRQLDDLSRQIVTLLIRHELIELVAEREDLSVNSAQVSKLLYDLGGPEVASKGTIWDTEGFRRQARDRLLMIELGRKTLRTAVNFDYTTAATRTAAIARAEQLAAAGPRGSRELISADADAGKDATVGKRVVAGDDPIFASSPAFGAAKGSVVAFQLADTQPWLIMVIRNHLDRAEPSDEAPEPDEIDPEVLEAIGLRQVAQIAENSELRLNPRYGVWDVVNMEAVPNKNETGGVIAPLATDPPA
jgi:hypothetical protein